MTDNLEITTVTKAIADREEPYKTMYITLFHAVLDASDLLHEGYATLALDMQGADKAALTTCLCHAITRLGTAQSQAETYFLDHPNAEAERHQSRLGQLRGEY